MKTDFKINLSSGREIKFQPLPVSVREIKKMWWALRKQKSKSKAERRLYETLTANLMIASAIVSVSVQKSPMRQD